MNRSVLAIALSILLVAPAALAQTASLHVVDRDAVRQITDDPKTIWTVTSCTALEPGVFRVDVVAKRPPGATTVGQRLRQESRDPEFCKSWATGSEVQLSEPAGDDESRSLRAVKK